MRTSLLLILIIVLAACGGSEDNSDSNQQPTPTPQPTFTVEERIQFPAGQVENPIQMVIRPVDTIQTRIEAILTDNDIVNRVNLSTSLEDELQDEETFQVVNQALLRDFELEIDDVESIATVADLVLYVQSAIGARVSDTIFDRTSLYVDVLFVDSYADALVNLCSSGTGIASMSWLDGVTYKAAQAQNCGQPSLQIAIADGIFFDDATVDLEATAEPEATAEATPEATDELEIDPAMLRTGQAGVIFANSDIGATSIGLVVDRPMCRLSVSDFYSWFLPSLLLERQGIDPLRAPSDIIEHDDPQAMVRAVRTGDCALASLPQDVFDSLNTNEVNVVETTSAFPYGILTVPVEIQLGVRLALEEDFISKSEEGWRDLGLLLGQDVFLPIEQDDLTELDTFFDGYDFVLLGS